MHFIISFAAGLIFGVGLIISGMANPAKVLGFLDLAGVWDPSLLFVMGGAIVVGLLAFRLAGDREKSLLGDVMRMPVARQIDRRLILGALTFGVGWGLAGFCPGPALTALAVGGGKAIIFVAAMLAGMAIFEICQQRAQSKASD